MKKTAVCLVAILLMASVGSADTLRYRASGPWQDLDDGTHGWISPDAPDNTDTVRANWGGATITLDYETTVNKFQAGVDESGTFQIQAGGILKWCNYFARHKWRCHRENLQWRGENPPTYREGVCGNQ